MLQKTTYCANITATAASIYSKLKFGSCENNVFKIK